MRVFKVSALEIRAWKQRSIVGSNLEIGFESRWSNEALYRMATNLGNMENLENSGNLKNCQNLRKILIF